MLQLNPTLKSLINKLWDRFWSGGISNPLSAIEQITYLLFMKQIDELDLKRQQDAEFTGDTFTSRFEGVYILPNTLTEVDKATLRWSYFKNLKSDEMLIHVQQRVFPFIKDLNGEGSAFSSHMANAVFIIPSGNLLQGAVQIIEDIFSEMEREAREQGHFFQDIQGDVYEMMLNAISTAGRNGQFRTPRHIIKLVSELVNPQLGNRICDPACGTGGFLLDAYQYIVTQLARQGSRNGQTFDPDEDGFIRTSVSGQLTQDVKDILEQNLYGYDFDSTMVRLALMNLMMHGIDNPRIDYRDTLSKRFTDESEYNVIMANPPFTGSIDKGDINDNLQLSTTKTELLFTERIFNLLTIGGTAGIIIPQGVLFGSGKAFVEVRKKLIDEAELRAVISLPSGVFRPYAGVATAILVFTRGGKTEHTWFYNLQNDGFSLDDKRQPIPESELPDVVAQWNALAPYQPGDRNAKHFFVPVQEIRDKAYDLSFNRYHEAEHDETEYEEPKDLLHKIETLEAKIQQRISELKGILK